MEEIKPIVYCCTQMAEQFDRDCNECSSKSDCPDYVILRYRTDFGNYFGIPIRDGGNSYYEIFYCPWCGKKLQSD